jgi:hypothetical protein
LDSSCNTIKTGKLGGSTAGRDGNSLGDSHLLTDGRGLSTTSLVMPEQNNDFFLLHDIFSSKTTVPAAAAERTKAGDDMITSPDGILVVGGLG